MGADIIKGVFSTIRCILNIVHHRI